MFIHKDTNQSPTCRCQRGVSLRLQRSPALRCREAGDLIGLVVTGMDQCSETQEIVVAED